MTHILITAALLAIVLLLPESAFGQAKAQATLRELDGAVVFVAYTSDTKHLITVTYEGAIHKWDASNGKEVMQIEKAFKPDGSMPDVRCRAAALSPDGKFLGVLSYASTLNLYTIANGKEYGQISTGDDQMSGAFGVAFNPDGKTVATGRFCGRGVTIWDLANGKSLRTLGDDAKPKGFTPFGRSPIAINGKTLAIEVGVFNNNQLTGTVLKRWDLSTGKELSTAKGPSGAGSFLLTPDARMAAWTNSSTREIRLWDLANDKEIRKLEGTGQARVFSPDGKQLAGRDPERVLFVWDTTTGKLLRKYGDAPANQPLNFRADVAAFSPDGKRLAAGVGGEVHQWDVASGKEVAIPK